MSRDGAVVHCSMPERSTSNRLLGVFFCRVALKAVKAVCLVVLAKVCVQLYTCGISSACSRQ